MSSYILGIVAIAGDLIRRRQAGKNFWHYQQLEFKRMASAITLRDLIGNAIFDPGAVVGFKGDQRDLHLWQLDAVMQVLWDFAKHRNVNGQMQLSIVLPLDQQQHQGKVDIRPGAIPISVTIGSATWPVGPGRADLTGCLHPESHVAMYRDPGDIEPHLQCESCGAKFLDRTSLEAARRETAELPIGVRDGVRAETAANPEPGTATGARATGWQVLTSKLGHHGGFHYAEGPGDLRIRTNDRALLDRILRLLPVNEHADPADGRTAIEKLDRFRSNAGGGYARVHADDLNFLRDVMLQIETFSMERICAKAGVDLGGNPLPGRRARLLDEALKLDLDDQHELAKRIAGNVGYVLQPEPEIDPILPEPKPREVRIRWHNLGHAGKRAMSDFPNDFSLEEIAKAGVELPEPKHMTAADCIDWSVPDQIRDVPGETPEAKLQRQSRDLVLMLVDWFNIRPDTNLIEGAATVMHRRLQRLVGRVTEPSLEPVDDAAMMKASEVYAAGRSEQVTVRHKGEAPQFYYDDAQMRAAFRSGYDYAHRK